MPALDIVVDDFELRGKKLGRLEIDAVNRGAAPWRARRRASGALNKLNLSMPEAFSATGNWAPGARPGRGRRRDRRRSGARP